MCIIDCLSTIVFILPLHLDYTKVIILILWWRNFQLEYWRTFQLVSTLMMKELYYYVPCEYWYDKQDRLRTDIEGRNTPMYMCECPTLAACIQWMIQTREYTFQTEQNVAVWHVVVRAGDYVLYDSESNADAFCCLEEALEKAVQECMELLY